MVNRHRFACAFFGSVIVATVFGSGIVVAAPLYAADSSTLESSAVHFKQFVLEQIAQSRSATKNMCERIAAHDLRGAQRAWLAARSGWERSEVITSEFFPEIERNIDAWPDAERGFHAIEAKLFDMHDVATLPAAEELVDNLADFERQLRTTTLTAQGLLNGATKLAYAIGKTKAARVESPFSGNSLAELRENLDSIAATYERVFARAIKHRDDGLAKVFSLDLDEIRELVSVRSPKELDQGRLRKLSEWLASDLVLMGQEIGLEKPRLGN